MQLKRIMNKIKKQIPDLMGIDGQGITIFFNIRRISVAHLYIIERIFKEYNVRTAAIGIDSDNNLYFDLMEATL